METLRKEILLYSRKVNEIYLPYLWNKWGVEPSEFSKVLSTIKFPRARIVDNLFVIEPKINPSWYEFCDTKYKRGQYVHKNQLERKFRDNQKQDQHFSVFAHDDSWIKNFQQNGTVSCRDTYVAADYIYLELDRENIDKAYADANHILFNFDYPEYMSFFYSGNRSIHIAVDTKVFGSPIGKQENVCGIGKLFYNIAHKVAGDIRHNNGMIDVWTINNETAIEEYRQTFKEEPPKDIHKVRQRLENIDPNLFNTNSLIRSPLSYHEKTGKQKIRVDITNRESYNQEQKILDFNKKIPYLIHYIYDCYEPVIKKKPIKKLTDNTEYVTEIFSKYIEDFDESNADANGFVNNLYSPFYPDTRPSVAVNIETGLYKDFGNPLDTYSLDEFLAKVLDISKEEAIELIKNEQVP